MRFSLGIQAAVLLPYFLHQVRPLGIHDRRDLQRRWSHIGFVRQTSRKRNRGMRRKRFRLLHNDAFQVSVELLTEMLINIYSVDSRPDDPVLICAMWLSPLGQAKAFQQNRLQYACSVLVAKPRPLACLLLKSIMFMFCEIKITTKNEKNRLCRG